jgi:beta-lactamase regulating signal transducer with metallopeptidase domain
MRGITLVSLWLEVMLMAQPTAMSTEPVGGGGDTTQNITRLLLVPPDSGHAAAAEPGNATVTQIKFVAYSVIANIVVGIGIVGNILNLVMFFFYLELQKIPISCKLTNFRLSYLPFKSTRR